MTRATIDSTVRHWVVLTLFPEMFSALCESGISGRAFDNGLCQLSCVNPRDYASDKHRSVDDKPYGGGPGMVMSYPPLASSIEVARQKLGDPPGRVVYLSPQGRKLDQAGVKRLAEEPKLILLCGRYEGIDERVIEDFVDEEVSVGDYVVSGGELPAMLLLDAMIRLLPGALGDENSAGQDSFSGSGLLDYPHYTRPEKLAGECGTVPEVLLSGNHADIARWRTLQSLRRTMQRRPELLDELRKSGRLNEVETGLLDELGSLRDQDEPG